MTRLSSRRTRRKPCSSACRSTSMSCTGSGDTRIPAPWARNFSGVTGASRGAGAGATSSSKVNMSLFSCTASFVGPLLMHCSQFFVQIIGGEVGAVMPRDRREPVIQVELGEAHPISERFEILAVEIVRQVHHPLAPIVEFQPD